MSNLNGQLEKKSAEVSELQKNLESTKKKADNELQKAKSNIETLESERLKLGELSNLSDENQAILINSL